MIVSQVPQKEEQCEVPNYEEQSKKERCPTRLVVTVRLTTEAEREQNYIDITTLRSP